MNNIKTSVRVVISIFLLSVALSNGQVITRRQQFNLFRQLQQQREQQQETEQRGSVIERQSEAQLAQVR